MYCKHIIYTHSSRGFALVLVHVGVYCAGALPVVVCCVSCFVHVCRYLQCACSVVPTCAPASLVLLLMPVVLHVWCYIALLRLM